jgi:hypothetical protein
MSREKSLSYEHANDTPKSLERVKRKSFRDAGHGSHYRRTKFRMTRRFHHFTWKNKSHSGRAPEVEFQSAAG